MHFHILSLSCVPTRKTVGNVRHSKKKKYEKQDHILKPASSFNAFPTSSMLGTDYSARSHASTTTQATWPGISVKTNDNAKFTPIENRTWARVSRSQSHDINAAW